MIYLNALARALPLVGSIPDPLRWQALDVAEHFIGNWYKWGGDEPGQFDCSGFVCEVLKSVGKIGRSERLNAQMIYDRFKKVQKPGPGVMVCYDDGGPIAHIEICIDESFTIGSSGGGPNTLTPADAIRDHAFIKVRPIYRQRHITGYCDPFLT
jgi:cell wall-associated NlpC family hydrolase